MRLAEARGDITNSPAIVWRYDRDTPYVPSPLLSGDQLDDGFDASPVAVDNELYLRGRRFLYRTSAN